MSQQPCPCRQWGLAEPAFITCELWLSVSHITLLIFCSVLYLIFCSCWSQQQQEKQAPLSITHGARSICIADVRGRSPSFAPWLLGVPQRDPVVSAPATALNWWQMLRAAGTAAQKYLCAHRTWTKSILCVSLWRSSESREGGTCAQHSLGQDLAHRGAEQMLDCLW